MQVECLTFCWSASHAARVPHMLLECLTCRWSASHERVPHMRPIGLRNSPSQLHTLLKVLLIQINWLSYSKFKTIIKYKILFIYTVINILHRTWVRMMNRRILIRILIPMIATSLHQCSLLHNPPFPALYRYTQYIQYTVYTVYCICAANRLGYTQG